MTDLAATFAPVSAPLRDWLREQAGITALVGTDGRGKAMVYADGLPTEVDLSEDTAVVLYTAGGLDGGTAMDRPFVRFNCWAPTAPAAEALAYALRAVLERALPQTRLGLAASPSNVRLMGATATAPIWMPDPDGDRPRYVVTATLTVRAVST